MHERAGGAIGCSVNHSRRLVDLFTGIATAILIFAFLAQRLHAQELYSISPHVSEGVLNMREGPGQNHNLIVAIPSGSTGVIVNGCRNADDGIGKHPWCAVRWKGKSGWVSKGGLVAGRPLQTEMIQRSALPNEIKWPVVFTAASQTNPLGLRLSGYTDDAPPGDSFLKYQCYYIGDGGPQISFTDEFLNKFKARGFSRRSLCMALMASIKFDPETGRKLPSFIMLNTNEYRRFKEEGYEDFQLWPGIVSEEVPLDVPDCFKDGTPLTDCNFKYDFLSGEPVSPSEARQLRKEGLKAEEILRDSAFRERWLRTTGESDRSRELHLGFGVTSLACNQEITGLPDCIGFAFPDYSDEFPKGFGYGLNVGGEAAPDPSLANLKVARESRATSSEAVLDALRKR